MRRRMRHGRKAASTEVDGRTLDSVTRGESVIISGIGDDGARMQAIRFGMGEGSCVTCVTKVPSGPIVVRSGRQEIAIGRALACRIGVDPLAGEVS